MRNLFKDHILVAVGLRCNANGCWDIFVYCIFRGRGGAKGSRGGKSPPLKISKKEKLLKLAFLTSLTRKFVLWKGFYHDFSPKKAFSFRGLRPLSPTKGLCPLDPHCGRYPLDPRGSFAAPKIYLGAAPV